MEIRLYSDLVEIHQSIVDLQRFCSVDLYLSFSELAEIHLNSEILVPFFSTGPWISYLAFKFKLFPLNF